MTSGVTVPLFRAPILVATIVALLAPVPAISAPPLAAYGQLPGISNVEVSPDGSKWAAILGDDTKAEIQIRELATNKLIAVTPTEKAKARGLQWVGPDHLVATVSTTADIIGLSGPRREWFVLIDYSLKDEKWRPVLRNMEDTLTAAAGDATGLMLDGKPHLIVPTYSRVGSYFVSTLFRVPLDTLSAKLIEPGNEHTNDWVTGSDGKALARADYNQKSGEWQLYAGRGGKLKRIYSEVAPLDPPYIRGIGANGDTLLVSTAKSGTRQTHDVSIDSGSWSEPRPELATDALLIDPMTRQLAGTVDTSLDAVDYRFLSENEQKLWRGLAKAFPGELVSLASWSDDRMTAIVEVDGPINGDAFFVVDRKAKKADFLAARYPGIGPADVAPVKAIRYKAADGTEIPAYVTLPRGRAAKGLPLILLAHGGPESRDYPGFDWWAQALASRGYAVLQPQFRGSSGFGSAHRDAGYGEWGRKMQTDLSDGVRHLVKDGTVDPKRVCIAGASYGGYAALAGPTLDPGVYRCASAVAGVSDLRRMLAAEINDANGSRENATLRYWKRFMGTETVNNPVLDTISPAKLVDKVTVPIQLIHGKDDTVVRYDQSTTMEKALRAAGKPVELVTLPSEDHWLSRAPTRIAMLNAMVAFLEKHNPPDPTAGGQ
jgi:dipeptidyl aminopeptidase/acylaminoacyl peptidase